MKKFEIKFGVVKNHEWVVDPEVEILHHEEQALTRYCELKRNAERGNPMLQKQFGKDYKTVVFCDVYANETDSEADMPLTQEFFYKAHDILTNPALESGTKSLPIETLTDQKNEEDYLDSCMLSVRNAVLFPRVQAQWERVLTSQAGNCQTD